MSIAKPHIVRPAVIIDTNVAAQTCTIQYADRLDSKRYTCPMPHPFVGAGWGILVGPIRGTRVMVDTSSGERPYIVGTIPMSQFSSDFSNPLLLKDVGADSSSYPKMRAGEVAIQSQAGTKLHFDASGAAVLSAGQLKFELDSSGAGSLAYQSRYENTEAHRAIAGLVKRDIRDEPKEVEGFLDKLIPVGAETVWSTVGRNPLIDASLLTFRAGQNEKSTRNPALVENRSITYEFARTAMVGSNSDEKARIIGQSDKESAEVLSQPNRRDLSRADVFNLGPHLPNNLIEKIEGTSVDVYGNIIDLNRNIIDFSGIDLKSEHRIEHEEALLRRSIKYHFELNARKHPLNLEGDPNSLDGHNSNDEATANGYSFSRWSCDIDGEGLTKINIPASSNVGNIPLLGRHINAHGEFRNDGSFRPKSDDSATEKRDVQHIAFGNVEGDGVAIPQSYAPPNIAKNGNVFAYRTAHHDIAAIAAEIIDSLDSPQVSAVALQVNNEIKSPDANAGGRSVHANLDGSLELNIGRDTIDRKSVVIDTAGSIVSRIGTDLNGHSMIGHADGNVLYQVGGGDPVRGEGPAAAPTVKFYVKNGEGFHKIEVREEGIFITSAPNSNIVLQSENNLVLSAKGQLLLGAESIFSYGSYAEDGNVIRGQRFVERVQGSIK